MMVTFVSQCEKKALNRTRRVLDSFANRIGDNTWQTVITNEGLGAVKKLLRKTASKNTAVSCFWLRSRSRSELVWVVGNRNKFDEQGVVPVNYTEKDIGQFMDKNKWKTLNIIKSAAAIAGLFHDFGKVNVLFQNKLDKNCKSKKFEPYRHEWVSLRLFQAFVGDKNDVQWLDALSTIEKTDSWQCFKDGVDGTVSDNNPISKLPPFAKLVAWLVLTHHKLALYPKWREGFDSPPLLENIDQWLDDNFDAAWNSPNCKNEDLNDLIEQNWNFKALPYESMQWRSHACIIASEAKVKSQSWIEDDTNTKWLEEQLFTTHFSRLCLILADHYYSSLSKIKKEWRSDNYQVWANTDRKTKEYKQKLDEHLIGVAYHANQIAEALPKLNISLCSLKSNKTLTNNVEKEHKEKFGWQDKAKKIAESLGKETMEQGFFGINMASTGRGKTLANAKIMTAIGSESGRIRFSVALGLRTLTLQTGKEYREKLNLSDEELAIAVGGIATKQLFENENKQNEIKEHQELTGSESENYFSDNESITEYKGFMYEHSLSQWTKDKPNLEKLIQAPVLVSTIDHLISATEGTRGDKHIAAMLRLLTSDLVLDEPDDLGLDDLPALCRLVNWAGMLGSRVLLSTATMPPALANALFQAYYQGWKHYAKANIENRSRNIVCAWFDEFKSHSEQCEEPKSHSEQCGDSQTFKEKHRNFVAYRIKALKKSKPKHKGSIINIHESDVENYTKRMATTIQKGINELHKSHKQSKDTKNISIGLVRMANINPLIAVAKELLKLQAPQDTCVHYCVYHSRYPLAVRSYIENKLDRILKRKTDKSDQDPIWEQPEIANMIEKHPTITNHIFIVLASPVAEVGRDHDYDWAVIEPSSMRSIIQLAGRVLRHRRIIPTKPNIILLNKNYRALTGKDKCFTRPGFESNNLEMSSYDLKTILKEEQYLKIDAIQRIVLPEGCRQQDNKYLNLVELEHKALANRLFSKHDGAKLWWEKHPYWCGEMQRQQRFRQSKRDEPYYLWFQDEYSELFWKWKNEHVYPAEFGEGDIEIKNDKLDGFGDGSNFWFNLDAKMIYQKLATDFKIDLKEVSCRFGEIRLIEYEQIQQEYKYHPKLGVYKIIGKNNE